MMRWFSLTRAGAVASVLAGALSAGAALADGCAPERLDIRGPWGEARFSVEIADDAAEQAQGLMFRDSLASSAGMLFVFPEPKAPAFWMKNTLIPLDMLFIAPDGTVAKVHPNAIPGDLTPIFGGEGILAVLEIKGGMAAALGIEAGDAVRHPAFDGAEAAWSCSDGGAGSAAGQ